MTQPEALKALIHFTVGDHDDSIVVCGESAEEIRKIADKEIARRNGVDAWSEVLEEEK